MSDPVTTAKVLLKQRDEWKAKYEEEVKLLNWLESIITVQDTKDDWGSVSLDHSVEGRGRYSVFQGTRLGVGKTLREAVRKAMEQS
ncbi:MAG: hypothetical protein ACXABD_21055 [Candidatus Thorarchaeota archaeon]|jgi:hypothetical protein